ncbi:neprilysin-1-like [Musca vetustissima]|uniref:neprilysin-1-like n=1 Tax=Musca vetustissima TaxID=27455 RepID=UPI002AB66EB8|nr:neprilysin-1-like [Musca vetustissima]
MWGQHFARSLLLLFQVFHFVDFGRGSPTVRLHLEENRISQNNDSEYVAGIMRLAKSAEMRNYMKADEDVCENYYEYACGNWPRLNPAETTASRKTSIIDLLETTYKQRQLRLLMEGWEDEEKEEDEIAEEYPVDSGNAEAVKKVKDFYKSCRKMSMAKKPQVVKEMREIIAEFGEMPALLGPEQEWEGEEEFNVFKLLGSIQHRYGFDIIIQLGLRPDFDNSSLHSLFVGQPALKLRTKSVYQGMATQRLREEYQKGIQDNLIDFLDMTPERAYLVAKGILEFEIQLSEGLMDLHTEKTLQAASIKRTPEELESFYGENMNFLTFLETTLGYPLNVTCYEYSLHYHEVLRRVLQSTPKAQVANYIMYKLVEPFFMAYDRSFAALEEMCLEKTKKFYHHVLDYMVYKSYDTLLMQHDIVTIWREVKQTFRQQMDTTRMDWLSEQSRKRALEKLDMLNLHINSNEKRNFTSEYRLLKINEGNYIENLKEINNLRVIKFLEQLSNPGKLELPTPQLGYSPVFVREENLIIIPVSLLQPNYLWSSYYPQALKFGTLGFLLAHELLHGFDDIGTLAHSHSNINSSNMTTTTWWDDVSLKAFKHKKSCFKNQYAHFRYNGKYLPMSDMQAENIADNGAIQIAYKSYIRWLNQQTLESLDELLPNMKLNNKKLFFLSFAQFFCVDVDEIMKDKVSLLDVHAPAKFRVIGPLANFPEFAKVFKCPQGSTMNPVKRCEIY